MASPLGLTNYDTIAHTHGKDAKGKDIIEYFKDGNVSNTGEKVTSIFRNTKFYYRPLMNKDTGDAKAHNNKIHGDPDLYDVSIPSIITHSGVGARQLRAADFAYLTDLGVYPNNRLMVCRRFSGPVPNDLTAVDDNNKPISTIVSWVDDKIFDGNFFKFNFGEKWEEEDGKGLFDIFSKVSKESGMNAISGLSGGMLSLGKAGGLPEGFQTALLVEMANQLYDDGSGNKLSKITVDNIPIGNPNLIQSAMKRVTGGDGLSADFSIPVKAKYEQKFINGVDPTIVFLDIIANTLRFGTSDSDFMITGYGGEKITDYFDKIKKGKWVQAVKVIIDVVVGAMTGIVKEMGDVLGGLIGGVVKAVKTGDVSAATDGAAGALKSLGAIAKKVGSSVISKYKVSISAAINALMGAPSTPWHITIGNPKKPFFASGDMYIDSKVEVKFGNVLSFNDLPSTIEVSFNLKNARELGGQEIFDKFNVGGGRSYEPIYKDQYENNVKLTADEIKSFNSVNEKDYEATKSAEASGSDTTETGENPSPGTENGGDNQAKNTTNVEKDTKKQNQVDETKAKNKSK